ncbi:MAG: DUF2007 domain-containing protein [Gammaproteobacteria bacterium]|nr:DUF2007 domain-containing protein [Gammaproteobacteria bacterium]
MQRVYVTSDPLLAGYCRSILAAHGVNCIASHEYLGGGAGEIPLTECWPAIWVIDDADAYRARRILEEALSGDHLRQQSWQCPHCGELLEPQFDRCWRCAQESSASED